MEEPRPKAAAFCQASRGFVGVQSLLSQTAEKTLNFL